jgi:hypothetical protein
MFTNLAIQRGPHVGSHLDHLVPRGPPNAKRRMVPSPGRRDARHLWHWTGAPDGDFLRSWFGSLIPGWV